MPPEVVIILESISNHGAVIKKEVVLIKDSSVLVNREKLSPVEIITQANNIKDISHFYASVTNSPCLAGRFRHIYKKGKIVKEERGCLSSERFNQLEKSFRALKKDRLTEVKD